MNASLDPSMNLPMGAMPGQMPATLLGTKLLWGSVAVLGVAVLAMGATLVNLQSQNQAVTMQRALAKTQAPADLLAMAPPAAGLAHTGAGAAASLAPGETLVTDKQVPPTIIIHNHMTPPVATEPMRPVHQHQAQRPAAPAQRTQAVQTTPSTSSAQVAQAPQAAPAAVPVATTVPSAPQVIAQAPGQNAPVVYSGYPPVVNGQPPVQTVSHPPVAQQPSSTLGTVESVTPAQRNAKAGGLGVVAGGVLGALVGNQIGKGSGRTLGTIVGAVGGGFAGNAIEKQMKKETVYQVGVRMDDGSLRTIEQASAPSIGSRINLNPASQAANTAPISPSTRPAVVTVGSERA